MERERFDPALLEAAASRATAGDPEAGAEVVARLRPMLLKESARIARWSKGRVELEDAYQEGCVILLRLLPAHDPARGDLLPYLTIRLRLKLNQWLDREKRDRGLESSVLESDMTPGMVRQWAVARDPTPDPEQAALARDRAAVLLGRAWSDQQRRVLLSRYWMDDNDAAGAARLGMNVPQYRQCLYRALRRLRDALEQQQEAA